MTSFCTLLSVLVVSAILDLSSDSRKFWVEFFLIMPLIDTTTKITLTIFHAIN